MSRKNNNINPQKGIQSPRTEAQLKEINQLIQEGVNHWATIMLLADADEWSVLLEYEPIDLHNTIFMLMHVASNIGLKAGFVCDEETATAMGEELRAFIDKYTGLDTHQLLDL